MRHLVFIALLCLTFQVIRAQGPLLDYSMLGSPGETYTYLDDTLQGDLMKSWGALSGANTNWNFNDSLTPSGNLKTVHYLSPDSLPLSATAFFLCNLGNTNNYQDYNYFKKNNNSIQYYGSRYVPPSGNAYVYYYGNPIALLQFPFAFGDSFTDYFTAGFPSIPGLSLTRRGSIQVTADAYGTAVMPGAQVFTDVLRVKNQILLTDSDYNAGRDSINDLYYDYYQGPRTFPLLQEGKRITYTSQSQSYSTKRYLYIRTFQSVSAPVKTIAENVATVFPNPAETVLYVHVSNEATPGSYLEISDTRGKKIQVLQALPGNTLEFDISNLDSGLYILRYQGVIYHSEHKFIKL